MLQNLEKESRIHFLFSSCRCYSNATSFLPKVLDGWPRNSTDRKMGIYRKARLFQYRWSYRRWQKKNSFEWVQNPDILESSRGKFKPKGNKLLSILELWTHSKQGDKPLNQWLTHIYNLVNICKYPEDSTDRIIRDVLIVGCNSNHARDKIIRQGQAVTLNQVIEILQTEESTHSTMQQIQDYQKRHTASIHYQTYDSRSKKSKAPSSEQNSSSSSDSTESKRQCFRCGEPFSRKHMKECRAKDVKCNGCGIKGHLKKCCKKSGNFPKDSYRQNQSSTGSTRMNYVHTAPLPQTEADFFDEKGLIKEYRPPVQQQQQQQYQQMGSMFALRKIPIIPISVSDPVPDPPPSPDFPFQEFLLTEVVNQSKIDSSSISDMLDLRENSNSLRKATKSTDLPLKSGLNSSTDEEMRENRDSTVSEKHTQSSRDSSTISISDNSTPRKSISGIMADTPSTFPVKTDITEAPEETQVQSSNNRSVMPTDVQALTVLQSLASDDFQVKNTPSTQRKGEDTPDTPSTQRKGRRWDIPTDPEDPQSTPTSPMGSSKAPFVT